MHKCSAQIPHAQTNKCTNAQLRCHMHTNKQMHKCSVQIPHAHKQTNKCTNAQLKCRMHNQTNAQMLSSNATCTQTNNRTNVQLKCENVQYTNSECDQDVSLSCRALWMAFYQCLVATAWHWLWMFAVGATKTLCSAKFSIC